MYVCMYVYVMYVCRMFEWCDQDGDGQIDMQVCMYVCMCVYVCMYNMYVCSM